MIDMLRESKPTDNSISRAADRKNQYYSLLYSEMAERKRVEEHLRRSNLLLQALSQAQLQYVAGTDLTEVFSSLLRTLLTVTMARLGFLCENNEGDAPLDGISLNLVEGNFVAGETHDYLSAIAGQVLQYGHIRLFHPASGTTAEFALPDAESFYYLGLPITITTFQPHNGALGAANAIGNINSTLHENSAITASPTIVGVIVISGAADEFDPSIVELMQPLLATCAQLIIADRNDARRRAAELELAEERVLLAQRVAERTAELSFSNAELARAARAKDEFLATMNHELRTPLNAVLLYAESLQTQLPGPLNERQLRAVGGIRESANHLLLLINDILDVAKMDAGKLNLDIKAASIENICQSSLRLVSEMALKKRLELRFDPGQDIAQLDVDERRLKQMLVNLLSNAIKFTPEGGSVGLEVRGQTEDNRVQFTVWDTGVGIAPEDIKKLFQPFVQLDGSHVRQHGGTGLGLFLVYRMAELHGGGISVFSEPTRGSRFTLSLPWHQPRQSFSLESMLPTTSIRADTHADIATNRRHSPNPNGEAQPTSAVTIPVGAAAVEKASAPSSFLNSIPTVLIADDNEANLSVLSDFLQEWNCRLLIARTGVEAVQQTKEERPNLVLMDIQMPEMNGLDAIRMIRAEPSVRHTPIVAVTALAMPGDREHCLAAGANDYLSKPIQIERLTELLTVHLKSMLLKEPL